MRSGGFCEPRDCRKHCACPYGSARTERVTAASWMSLGKCPECEDQRATDPRSTGGSDPTTAQVCVFVSRREEPRAESARALLCPVAMASGWLRVSALMQKYRSPLLISTCSGLFGLNLVQHLVPDQTFCSLYQAWSKGEPVQLSPKLEKLFQQVLQDYCVSSPQKFLAFASFGFHPVGAGLPLLPSGVHVGIPANFNSSEEDTTGITDRTIFINGRAVDWSSATGTALRHALVLSEPAQKFALAREVARLDGCLPVLSAAVAPACVGGVWVYSVLLKQVFGLHSGPMVFRVAVNALSLCLGAVSYFLCSDAVGQFVDYSSDRRAAAVSPLYANGGVEFYDKILSRNRTLRSLMGQKGEEMYAPNGNLFPANLLQLKHAPYTARRDGIQAMITQEKA
ncbi:transmembrane protein 177 isoform X2 [Boleophthalmus pectinirostris]|uniref:transmembrane protein 177 isoform X2 n=1 Tax=Boleophthalmus pectinirostris TaxID=150288 RepID=UPI00242DDE4E|nr:transmembrane protein 177 isoform X2 [Boleophthalmus pectinirostris]